MQSLAKLAGIVHTRLRGQERAVRFAEISLQLEFPAGVDLNRAFYIGFINPLVLPRYCRLCRCVTVRAGLWICAHLRGYGGGLHYFR